MSLNWDATKAPRWDELDWDKKESLIFATMAVDMGEITTANVRDFYKRYLMFVAATGQSAYLTLEDVEKGVGLHTNVSTTTYPAYKKRLVGILERHAEDRIWAENRKREEAS